jgi:hypothetical protein
MSTTEGYTVVASTVFQRKVTLPGFVWSIEPYVLLFASEDVKLMQSLFSELKSWQKSILTPSGTFTQASMYSGIEIAERTFQHSASILIAAKT